MVDPAYAIRVWCSHYERAKEFLGPGYVVCEIGPGDSIATALICRCFGAESSILVDAGDFASFEPSAYADLATALDARDLCAFQYSPELSREQILAENNARYLTSGLDSLAEIPSGTVDFVFSQAVLEHVRLEEFDDLVEHTYRILKTGGIASHEIDLKDHLGGGLNNLRFRRSIWESSTFASSGFYTNRLRAGDIHERLVSAGFRVLDEQRRRFADLPLNRRRLDPEFASLQDAELLTAEVDFLLAK